MLINRGQTETAVSSTDPEKIKDFKNTLAIKEHGRELSFDDIEHYQKIMVALEGTISIMLEIDELIEGYGRWVIRTKFMDSAPAQE